MNREEITGFEDYTNGALANALDAMMVRSNATIEAANRLRAMHEPRVVKDEGRDKVFDAYGEDVSPDVDAQPTRQPFARPEPFPFEEAGHYFERLAEAFENWVNSQ